MEELMKKILLVIVLIVMCMGLFAQIHFAPYGSARAGFFYTMTDEDFNNTRFDVESDRLQMDLSLQPNSRFGVNFKNDDGLTANVELGANGTIRFLWAKQTFENWSLLVGLTEDATNQGARQVAGGDNMLRGWGAVYNGRNPMIRAEWNNFYLAMIQPHTNTQPIGATGSVDALIPRINLGYNWTHKTVRLLPTFVLQMYDYNDDFGHDGSVMAWLGALTFDYNENNFGAKVHVNFGTNIAQMGYVAPSAAWDVVANETQDVTTLGAVLTLGYDFSPTFNLNVGVGYKSSDSDEWDETDDRMAFYLQGVFKIQNIRITPEVGMLNYMDDLAGDPRGTVMYFGSQFRFDF